MMFRKLSPEQFRDHLFDILSRKQHWTNSHFNGSTVTNAQLRVHFRQEYAVYLRDFAVLLGRIMGKNPSWQIRRHLATTIYEEETGGLSLGKPHQESFLQMMMGLGFSRAEFREVELLAPSWAYREWLDGICQDEEWLVGAANLTIFVEGTANDREEVLHQHQPKTKAEIEDIVLKHPLVVYHGLSPEYMDLVRVREMIEPCNRRTAYDLIVKEAVETGKQKLVLGSLEQALNVWLQYREGIARACGLRRP